MQLFSLAEAPLPLKLPLMQFLIPAGFPSPATDYVEKKIDLTEELIANPAFTFFARNSGNSMWPTIQPDNLLLIDFKAELVNGCVVMAVINSEFCIRRLYKYPDGSVELRADNPEYKPIFLPSEFEGEFEIRGRVIWNINDPNKCKP